MSQYDAFAQDFSQTRQRSWPEFELLYPLLKKNDRICDLGCGNARLRMFLDPQIIPEGNYYGLDISEELLKIGRSEFPKDHFFRGDFTSSLPFGDDQFDHVTAVASFHHILSKKEQHLFLSECRRILRPGGTLFVTTWILPKKYKWNNILSGRWKNWIIPFGLEKHPRTYRNVTKGELKRLLKAHKYTDIQVSEFEGRNLVVLAQI